MSILAIVTSVYNLCLVNTILEGSAGVIGLLNGHIPPITSSVSKASLVAQAWAIAALALAAITGLALSEGHATQVFALKGTLVYHALLGGVLLYRTTYRSSDRAQYLVGGLLHAGLCACILLATGMLRL